MRHVVTNNEGHALAIRDCPWNQEAVCPKTLVWVSRDADLLKIRFQVMESDPRITCHAMNEPVYTDSCVEFFVQPLPGRDDRFLNFEMNAEGTLLLGLGVDRHDRLQLQEEEIHGIQIVPGRGVDQHGQPFWSIELAVPFAWLKEQVPGFEPYVGAFLKANFYKCGDMTPVPHYGSWNPMTGLEPDFHRSEDFGELVLV